MILTDILLLILNLLVFLALSIFAVRGIIEHYFKQVYYAELEEQQEQEQQEQQSALVFEASKKPCGFGSNWRTVKNSEYEEDEDDEEDEEDEPDGYVDEVYCNDNSRRGKRTKRGSKTAISNN